MFTQPQLRLISVLSFLQISWTQKINHMRLSLRLHLTQQRRQGSEPQRRAHRHGWRGLIDVSLSAGEICLLFSVKSLQIASFCQHRQLDSSFCGLAEKQQRKGHSMVHVLAMMYVCPLFQTPGSRINFNSVIFDHFYLFSPGWWLSKG